MDVESSFQEKIKAMFGKIKGKTLKVAKNTMKIGQDDPRRITHSLKVGLALTLVSLFYYFRPLYDGFGQSGMWAVLTVVVVFEFSVGATLSKSMNRGIATLVAGALGVGAAQLASLFGGKGEPIVLGILLFILAAASTFIRFFPHIKARYDYGMLIFILTFSLVSISGYRVDEILELAHQRLSTILLGGAICMIVSIFIWPVWAGEDLSNLVAANLEKLAIFLEGFGSEFLKSCDDGHCGMVPRDDMSFLHVYKSVLNTKNSEESLANFAWWEPGHGSFGFHHPWKSYLKIGVFTRKCGYHIETLSNYINSELKIPTEVQTKIKGPCMKMSSESAMALKELASSIKTMTHLSSPSPHIQKSKAAINDLKTAIECACSSITAASTSNLLEIIPALTAASVLTDIIRCIENISDSVCELSQQAHFKKKLEDFGTGLPERLPQLLHRGTVNPVGDGDSDDDGDKIVITIHEISSELPENAKPQPQRLA